ncbi:16S rRNA (guanine(966)-N(2))-methyltransferase RsmD [Vaccinium witches'-broom phytoplasma]|uniref:16S rRNA (guanine(966)-N(2))-methyltransferase RsmD n=1 Tax=Vaccinium witches'-broom phytoplasma TaxID=85642 RepID=UPI0003710C08|nr:16S rRNA (guanine(966)-N(2))-methyltransferase RsmD [Vaccinium witches'-broom phytoplasma]
MLQIISGKYKGFRLVLVPSEKTKSTSHLVRKALFDTIGAEIEGQTVLDLFSGSGVYGFEALSRKAKAIYMVDNLLAAYKAIKKNCQKLQLKSDEVHIFYGDAFRMLKKFIKEELIFDFIILDPPYFSDYFEPLLKVLSPLTNQNSLVICETNHKMNLPSKINDFHLIKSKKYGSQKLNYYRKVFLLYHKNLFMF